MRPDQGPVEAGPAVCRSAAAGAVSEAGRHAAARLRPLALAHILALRALVFLGAHALWRAVCERAAVIRRLVAWLASVLLAWASEQPPAAPAASGHLPMWHEAMRAALQAALVPLLLSLVLPLERMVALPTRTHIVMEAAAALALLLAMQALAHVLPLLHGAQTFSGGTSSALTTTTTASDSFATATSHHQCPNYPGANSQVQDGFHCPPFTPGPLQRHQMLYQVLAWAVAMLGGALGCMLRARCSAAATRLRSRKPLAPNTPHNPHTISSSGSMDSAGGSEVGALPGAPHGCKASAGAGAGLPQGLRTSGEDEDRAHVAPMSRTGSNSCPVSPMTLLGPHSYLLQPSTISPPSSPRTSHEEFTTARSISDLEHQGVCMPARACQASGYAKEHQGPGDQLAPAAGSSSREREGCGSPPRHQQARQPHPQAHARRPCVPGHVEERAVHRSSSEAVTADAMQLAALRPMAAVPAVDVHGHNDEASGSSSTALDTAQQQQPAMTTPAGGSTPNQMSPEPHAHRAFHMAIHSPYHQPLVQAQGTCNNTASGFTAPGSASHSSKRSAPAPERQRGATARQLPARAASGTSAAASSHFLTATSPLSSHTSSSTASSPLQAHTAFLLQHATPERMQTSPFRLAAMTRAAMQAEGQTGTQLARTASTTVAAAVADTDVPATDGLDVRGESAAGLSIRMPQRTPSTTDRVASLGFPMSPVHSHPSFNSLARMGSTNTSHLLNFSHSPVKGASSPEPQVPPFSQNRTDSGQTSNTSVSSAASVQARLPILTEGLSMATASSASTAAHSASRGASCLLLSTSSSSVALPPSISAPPGALDIAPLAADPTDPAVTGVAVEVTAAPAAQAKRPEVTIRSMSTVPPPARVPLFNPPAPVPQVPLSSPAAVGVVPLPDRAGHKAGQVPKSLMYTARTRMSCVSVKVHSHPGSHEEYAARLQQSVSRGLRGLVATAAATHAAAHSPRPRVSPPRQHVSPPSHAHPCDEDHLAPATRATATAAAATTPALDAPLVAALAAPAPAACSKGPADDGDEGGTKGADLMQPVPQLGLALPAAPAPGPVPTSSIITTATVRGCVQLFAWVHGPAGEQYLTALQQQHAAAQAGQQGQAQGRDPNHQALLPQHQLQQQDGRETGIVDAAQLLQHGAMAAGYDQLDLASQTALAQGLMHQAVSALSMQPGWSHLTDEQRAMAIVNSSALAVHSGGLTLSHPSVLAALHSMLPDAAALPQIEIQYADAVQQYMLHAAGHRQEQQEQQQQLSQQLAAIGAQNQGHGLPQQPPHQFSQMQPLEQQQQQAPQAQPADLASAIAGPQLVTLECMWSPCVPLVTSDQGDQATSDVEILIGVAREMTIRVVITRMGHVVLDTSIELPVGQQLVRLPLPAQYTVGCLHVIITPQPRSQEARRSILYDTAMLLAVPAPVSDELRELVQVMQLDYCQSRQQQHDGGGSSNRPAALETAGGSEGAATARAGVWREHYAPLISDIAFLIEAALGPHDQQTPAALAALAAQATAMEQELCAYLQANAMPATLQLMHQAVAAVHAAAAAAASAAASQPLLNAADATPPHHMLQPSTADMAMSAAAAGQGMMAAGGLYPQATHTHPGHDTYQATMDLADDLTAMNLGSPPHTPGSASTQPSPHVPHPSNLGLTRSEDGTGLGGSATGVPMGGSFLWGASSPMYPQAGMPPRVQDVQSAPDLPCLPPPPDWGSTTEGAPGAWPPRWFTGGSTAGQLPVRPGSDGASADGAGMAQSGGFGVPRSHSEPQAHDAFLVDSGVQLSPVSGPPSTRHCSQPQTELAAEPAVGATITVQGDAHPSHPYEAAGSGTWAPAGGHEALAHGNVAAAGSSNAQLRSLLYACDAAAGGVQHQLWHQGRDGSSDLMTRGRVEEGGQGRPQHQVDTVSSQVGTSTGAHTPGSSHSNTTGAFQSPFAAVSMASQADVGTSGSQSSNQVDKPAADPTVGLRQEHTQQPAHDMPTKATTPFSLSPYSPFAMAPAFSVADADDVGAGISEPQSTQQDPSELSMTSTVSANSKGVTSDPGMQICASTSLAHQLEAGLSVNAPAVHSSSAPAGISDVAVAAGGTFVPGRSVTHDDGSVQSGDFSVSFGIASDGSRSSGLSAAPAPSADSAAAAAAAVAAAVIGVSGPPQLVPDTATVAPGGRLRRLSSECITHTSPVAPSFGGPLVSAPGHTTLFEDSAPVSYLSCSPPSTPTLCATTLSTAPSTVTVGNARPMGGMGASRSTSMLGSSRLSSGYLDAPHWLAVSPSRPEELPSGNVVSPTAIKGTHTSRGPATGSSSAPGFSGHAVLPEQPNVGSGDASSHAAADTGQASTPGSAPVPARAAPKLFGTFASPFAAAFLSPFDNRGGDTEQQNVANEAAAAGAGEGDAHGRSSSQGGSSGEMHSTPALCVSEATSKGSNAASISACSTAASLSAAAAAQMLQRGSASTIQSRMRSCSQSSIISLPCRPDLTGSVGASSGSGASAVLQEQGLTAAASIPPLAGRSGGAPSAAARPLPPRQSRSTNNLIDSAQQAAPAVLDVTALAHQVRAMSVCLHYKQAGLITAASSSIAATASSKEEGRGAAGGHNMGEHDATSQMNHAARMVASTGVPMHDSLDQVTATAKGGQRVGVGAPAGPTAEVAQRQRVDAPLSAAVHREVMIAAFLWYFLGVFPILYMAWEGFNAKWF